MDEELFVDEEVLLLTADGREHPLDGFVTKQMRNLDRLPLQRLAGAHQRGLLVERLAGVGAEGRRDAQRATGRVAPDEGRARGVPSGVTTCLEGLPDAAGWEARGVRLTLNQLATIKLDDRLAVAQV